jgi:hypothetical protein
VTVPFVLLTGTELAVLEEAHARLLDPGRTSWVRTDSGDVLDVAHVAARAEALRSLTVRGLVGPEGVLREDDPLSAGLALALDVRAASEGVLVVERTVQVAQGPVRATTVARVAHLTRLGACVEDVGDDEVGEVHGLALLTDPEEVTTALTDVLVPPDAAPGAGPPRRVTSSRATELVRDLGRPTVLAEITWAPADGVNGSGAGVDAWPGPGVRSWLVALGPGGCFGGTRGGGTRGDGGRGADQGYTGGTGDVVLDPVEPGWVGDLLGRLVSAVVEGPGEEEGTMTG